MVSVPVTRRQPTTDAKAHVEPLMTLPAGYSLCYARSVQITGDVQQRDGGAINLVTGRLASLLGCLDASLDRPGRAAADLDSSETKRGRTASPLRTADRRRLRAQSGVGPHSRASFSVLAEGS